MAKTVVFVISITITLILIHGINPLQSQFNAFRFDILFLGFIILYLPLSFDYQLIFLMWGFTFTLLGVISLIFYFINPEITYGIWISRKKAKNFNNRYIKIGRRIQIAILLTGLGIFTALFILIISVLFL